MHNCIFADASEMHDTWNQQEGIFDVSIINQACAYFFGVQ